MPKRGRPFKLYEEAVEEYGWIVMPKEVLTFKGGIWQRVEKGDLGILTTQGDLLFHNGTNPARLPPGTAGQFLMTQGPGANPVWADAPAGVWMKIADIEITTPVTAVSITGLTGETDVLYKLLLRSVNDHTTETQQAHMRINADTAANYDYQYLTASLGTVASSRALSVTYFGYITHGVATYEDVGTTVAYIYAKSGEYRSCVYLSGAHGRTTFVEGRWKNKVSEITSLDFFTEFGNFGVGTRFILFKLVV